MKTMQDFAAQQLTKKQMNQVKGGAVYYHLNCSIVDVRTGKTVEWSHSVIGDTIVEATNNMLADLREGQMATDCRSSYLIV